MLFQNGWRVMGVRWKLCSPAQAARWSWGHAQHCGPDREPGGAHVCGGLGLVGASPVGKMAVFCGLREATSPAPDVC